jgi:hypothetical protein
MANRRWLAVGAPVRRRVSIALDKAMAQLPASWAILREQPLRRTPAPVRIGPLDKEIRDTCSPETAGKQRFVCRRCQDRDCPHSGPSAQDSAARAPRFDPAVEPETRGRADRQGRVFRRRNRGSGPASQRQSQRDRALTRGASALRASSRAISSRGACSRSARR